MQENQITLNKQKVMEIEKVNVWINNTQILNNITTTIDANTITTIIGPSGAGKSTFVRTLNRINDTIPEYKFSGEIKYNKENIYGANQNVYTLRKQIGMIFQKPCVFPKSITENVLFGIDLSKKSKQEKDKIVEEKLKAVHLWNEVQERLNEKASNLSVGQQQRLCIARALAVNPDVIIMDEPTSSLDPISTLKLEQLIVLLKKKYTIILVTHNIDQAKRVSDNIIFMCNGKIVEQGSKDQIMRNPKNKQTQDYVSWNTCNC